MKLRTKFIILAILVALLTGLSLLVYVAYISRTTILSREQNFTRVTSSIAFNAIMEQYDIAITQQIIDVYHIKNNLRESAATFTYLHSKLIGHNPNRDHFASFLKTNQEAYEAEGTYLIAYYNGQFWGSQKALSLLDANTFNKNNIRELLVGEIPALGTYDIAKKDSRTYLTYIFTPPRHREFNFAFIKNVDRLFSSYDNVETDILMFARELFSHVHRQDVTPLYLLNQNSEILETNDENAEAGSRITPLIGDIVSRHDTGDYDRDIQCVTDSGDYLCFGYIKPLKMYVLSRQTLFEILNTGNKIMYGMTAITLSVLFIIIILSVGYIRRVTESLNNIAQTAHTIARADLSDPGILKSLNIVKYNSNDEVGNLSLAISNMSNSLITNINALLDSTARENRIKGELGVAYDIQMGMLPGKESIPRSKYYEISAFIHPAKEVGGDFYDVFQLNEDHLVLTIGDVSDKGVPAAMFMSICVTMLRQIYKTRSNIEAVLRDVNNCLSERNPNLMFVTLFTMIVNIKTGDFSFCNAGHCPPLIVRKTELYELSHLSGPALGVMGNAEYVSGADHLDPDDYIFIYTDGISEAQNTEKQFYGDARIREALEKRDYNSAKSQVYSILDAVIEFRGAAEQSDDMTVLSFRRNSAAAAKKPSPEEASA
ncbi:SpoIIE family protein phosphatase [Succinimonas sp.]|uniref:SpoIIE family protein phosphatase n=1 Tax=Succinimonas sp. TaxID=1936151 RepID=UPI0038705603